MIKINLSPVRSDDASLKADWQAPVLTVNGEAFDISELEDGATAQHPILGTVERTGDDYEVTLRLPHGPEHWQRTERNTPDRYHIGDQSFTDRAEGLAHARLLPPDTDVRIDHQRCYVRAGEAQRFPEPVTMTKDGPVPVPEPDEDWRTETTDDIDAFKQEAWGQ